ncbi:hypothetical protein [Alteromonas sp. H39]|uniref:hypothetical protein n=1 Tax=Alteromonas sp. H39 TaxID=3389876 RepID=UPI0039E0864E
MTINQHASPPAVVVKAFTWAYEELGWSRFQAAELLSVPESVLANSQWTGFESDTVQHRIQLSFIRMYHLLYALSEGDTDTMQQWLKQHNAALQVPPVTLCDSLEGLERIVLSLESEQSLDKGDHADHVLPVSLSHWE